MIFLLLLGLHAIPAASRAEGAFLQLTNGYLWDPAKQAAFIPRGIAYQTWNPPVGANQSLDQIDYDLTEFAKMSANSVRCEFVWEQVEIAPGVFDWSKPEALAAKAEALGLRLFVLIGFQYAPAWFPDEWRALNDQGQRSRILNYELPEARAAFTNYIGQVACHFRTAPVIGAWILGNEVAYFDLWEAAHRRLGYDPVSVASFRRYLASAYAGDIAALNHNWRTTYADFDSVAMPTDYPASRDAPAYHDLIQWRKQSIGRLVAAAAVAARTADPNHLLTYSMVGGLFGDYDALYTCEDARTIVAECRTAGAPLDFWSINNYAVATFDTELRSADFGIGKHRAQSGLPVLVSETGHTSTETLHVGARERQAKAVPSQLWEAFMSGAIGVHAFTWNDRDVFVGDNSPREQGFGMVDARRLPKTNGVLDRVRQTFRRMDSLDMGALLAGSRARPVDVQILWSTNADLGWPRANHENCRLWSALKRVGFQPGFLDDEQFESDGYTNAPALLLSRCYQMSPRQLEAMATRVLAAGVHVHANADLPGQFNAYHQTNAAWPDFTRSVFGLDVTQAAAVWDAGAASFDGSRDYGTLRLIGVGSLGPFDQDYRAELRTWKIVGGVHAVRGTTIVQHNGLAAAPSRSPVPALHLDDLGAAKVAVNTFALGDSESSPNDLCAAWDFRFDWLRAIYRDHFGLVPTLDVKGPPGAKFVMADYRMSADGSVLISLFNEHTNDVSVILSAPTLLPGCQVENVTTGGVLPLNPDGTVSLTLAGDDYLVLRACRAVSSAPRSTAGPAVHKIWFVSTPTIVWPNAAGYDVHVACDTGGAELSLCATLERIGSRSRIFGRSAATPVAGRTNRVLSVPLPDADLGDPDYASSRGGASYVWRAWLEDRGRRVAEVSLPVRLVWGVRPAALPPTVAPGRTCRVTLEWEELPSFGSGASPTPLSRAALWDSLESTAEYYRVVLELRSGGSVVASDNLVTRVGTGSHEFSLRVPNNTRGPFTWTARVEPVSAVSSHDVLDGFEGRVPAAWAADLAQGNPVASPMRPWSSYHYPTNGTQQWLDEGVALLASEGSQSAFLLVTNPAAPAGYSGFGIRRVFDQDWDLLADQATGRDWTFACDFQLAEEHACLIELQVKNDDPNGTGRWIEFSQPYVPGSNGWGTIRAPLSSFAKPSWSFARFDPSRVHELVVNVQMLETNALYAALFDNIRFEGPARAIAVGPAIASYTSENDSPAVLPDRDHDGVPDAYETGTGVYVSPTNTGTDPDNTDSDGDGQTDGAEVAAGTNPNDARDVFAIASIRRSPDGETALIWMAKAGRAYDVLCRDDLAGNAQGFQPLPGLTAITVTTDGPVEVRDHSMPRTGMRFYRVVVDRP